MYSHIYNFIQKIILKKSLSSDAANLIKNIKVKNIIDVGCGESDIFNYFKIKKSQRYYGYELDDYFVIKLKKKLKKKNINFYKKDINQINFKNFDHKNSIILLIGIFHHLDNRSIKKFIKKVKKFKFLSIDAVILPNQSFITKILFFLDRGRFIRELKDYKKLLVHANYKLLRNRYIRAPYDHVMFFKNIDKKKIDKILRKI